MTDYDLTLWFLDNGADPNAACALDMTPLSVAIETAPMNVIELLFSRGGSASSGQLLHYAVRRDSLDRNEVVRLVLQMNPAVNNVMYQGLECYFLQRAFGLGTPLHEAVELAKVDTAKLLLDQGANPLVRDSLGETTWDRVMRLGTDARKAMIELLHSFEPYTPPASPQFTDGKRATGWG